MTIHRTPDKDWDALAAAREHLAAVGDLLDVAEQMAGVAELEAEYLAQAGVQARLLALAVQTAAGRAQVALEAQWRAAGREECRGGCGVGHWYPKSEMTLMRAGYGGKDASRQSRYWACHTCCPPEENEL